MHAALAVAARAVPGLYACAVLVALCYIQKVGRTLNTARRSSSSLDDAKNSKKKVVAVLPDHYSVP